MTDNHSNRNDNNLPKVAIRCVAYNHGKFIRDCLEGFVMQKTDFPFVAIVHDDASTDNTADIIREYAEKYPHIIKPIYETENQYSKPGGVLRNLMNKACLDTGAPYIAMCEGDDYWTDPYKLQKQVDFLDSHPDYSLVFTSVDLFYEQERNTDRLSIESREYSAFEIYTGWIITTPSVMFRSVVWQSELFKKLNKIKRPVFGDLTLFMSCSSVGKLRGLDNISCVHRRLSSGATMSFSLHPYRVFRNRVQIARFFGKKFIEADYKVYQQYFSWAIAHIDKDFPENLAFASKLFLHNPLKSVLKTRAVLGSIAHQIKYNN